jgi:hypothetical protein
MLGKLIYRTSMLNLFRLIVLAVTLFFLNDFYLETLTQPKFMALQSTGFFSRVGNFFSYHWTYPGEFLSFFCVVLFPAIYFSFIRGVRFHEKGFKINRGLPFFNQSFMYTDIRSYKLLHPKYAIAVYLASGETLMIADNTIERVIAIVDQHNVRGDLAQDDFVKLITSYRNFLIFVVSFVLILFFVRKLGLFFFNT